MILSAKRITKRIRKSVVLDDISLELHGGKVYGFVGPNGCGKTMLFRALSGLISINSGAIMLDDNKLGKDFSVLPSLGIVLENVGMYPNLTGYENLSYLAKFKNAINKDDIKHAILQVGLDPEDKRTYKKYSLGMKQRLAIAQAIMEAPDVVMLDEPTNALDRESVERVRKVILDQKKRGALILLASHNEEDVRLLSDVVFEMENGRIVRSLEVNEKCV